MSKCRDLSLSELESELRNAYVKKVLECQIKEKEAEREFSRVRAEYDDNLEKWKNLIISKEEREKYDKIAKEQQNYRRELEEQISEKERMKKLAEIEARRERKLLEEFDRIVEEYDFSRKIEMKKQIIETRNRDKIIMEEMRIIRERKKLEEEMNATREIKNYEDAMEKRILEHKAISDEQKKRRNRLIERVAKVLIDMEAEKSIHKDSKIRDMVAEEISWEIVLHERDEELRRERMKKNLIKGLERQIEFSIELRRREAELDKEFFESVMKRLMEHEKIEKLTKEARARKVTNYRRDLMKLMEEREIAKQKEIERIESELKREMEIEEARRERILEARREILLKHAKNVGPRVREDFLTDEERKIIARVLEE